MSPSRWSGFPPPAAPRPVEGGVVARSARGRIGEQWWSRRFVEVLESFALGSRLTRGRSYARKGQVVSLDVGPGEVRATVQGTRRTPYTVSIELAPFPELVWAKLEVALAEQAIHSARLLAGEMPADLEDVLAAAGAPLFPERASDLTMTCSCPDVAVPCKHIAATFYLLAESFDEDPFRILAWRGRQREPLLARLRELRGDRPADPANTGVPAEPPSALGAARALDEVSVAPREEAFWEGAEPPSLPSHPDLPVDLLLRQLPPPSRVLGGPALGEHLRGLYRALAGETAANRSAGS
ncbi:MAG: SWIM zinc finger family protein [Actinomycetota bacterium]